MNNKPTSYIVIRGDRAAEPVDVGSTVYELLGWDYALARHDTRIEGIKYASVTFDAKGGYPFFTIPAGDLKVAT